ncbi:hypothetical protein M407DRAFT_18345 [Tulasnella calospora MUT 4182]|uniref:Cytochrome P450 n=2 Tax=Tulasnella calospora MUT 4182 TaxID=1051891 RepID=A0A0C3MGS5_9AGAM|nr:hypothetical protein M407DRAFT_18345 [Tulasnella calospora MUT 4182]
MDSLPVSPAVFICGAFATYTIGTWIYNLFFHPLRHVPGPWYTAISSSWLSFQDMAFKKALVIDELHQKYGPVVRVEPNVVAFLDAATTRFVYSSTSKLPKSQFYKALLTNENDHAMTTLDPLLHAPKKRAYGPHYTPNNLSLYQPEMREYTQLLLEKMDSYKGQKSFDCLVLFRRLLVDVIFVSSYGQRINSLKQWDTETFKEDPASEIVASINLFPIRGVFRASVPKYLWDVLCKIPIKAWKRVVDSDRRVAEYVIAARDKLVQTDKRLDLTTGDLETDGETDERLSLIHRLLRQQVKAKAEDRLSDRDIISEAMGHTIAGVDTSSTTLSYMMYTLANRPDILAKLREEIDPLMPDDGQSGKRTAPDFLVLNRLPYLTGFVKESLRLYGSGPSLLERVVPQTLQGEFSIKGIPIPAGSVVGTQAWSVHRDPAVFPDPYAFQPERWLEETEEMRSAMMPFGTGGRICGGMNLAQYMLRIALVSTIRNFDVVVPPETTPESMACRFAFVLLPAAQRVDLIFTPRKD